jgi:transposase
LILVSGLLTSSCLSLDDPVFVSLSVRTHRCACGFVANRDHNTAINILRVGLDGHVSDLGRLEALLNL